MSSDREKPSRVEYLKALCRTVPYHVVEAVLDAPGESAVVSQEFEGSILHADLVGFTSTCERLANEGPEGLTKVTDMLNGLFGELLEKAIFPYRGYVIEFGGDSLSVVFRGPDHAWRAAAAALMAQCTMYGEVGRLLGSHVELMLRVGVAAGTVHLPVVGDLAQRAVVCAGTTAHRALLLQKRAEPNAIVVDNRVLERIGSRADVVGRSDAGAVLRGLRGNPRTVPIATFGDRVEAQVEEKIALLEPFVPQPLAARLKSRPKSWWSEGELRRMVVLFADVWGLDDSTGTVERGRDVSRSLSRAFRKYGGVTLKANLSERGHRLMVIYGLHHPSANDPERALLAALEATARVRTLTAGDGQRIGMRAGVHVGKVYLGAIGSAIKHDLTVIGDAVNIAARAASHAGPFEILATDAIVGAAGSSFDYSQREPIRVKGKSKPLTLHVVHTTSEPRAHYVRKRKHQRFCAGRKSQRQQLEQVAREALASRGQMIGLCGESGTGKSFMLSEVIDQWADSGGIGLLGRCTFGGTSTPLSPVVQLFSSFLGLTESDSETVRRERIRAGLNDFGLTDGAPELMALLQPVRRPDGTDEALIDLAEPRSRERVLDSIVEFVEIRLEQERVLYVLEDLHFADTLTLELALRMMSMPEEAPFLFVATYRPLQLLQGVRHKIGAEVVLEDLTLGESSDLIGHEVGASKVDPELAVFLWQRTKGNPGYLVEVVRFLNDRGLVTVRAGVALPAYGDLQVLDDVVPPSLSHVALARLDELGSVERRVLRTASVIGRRFDRVLLERAAVAQVDDELVESGMATLQGRGVIIPSSHRDDGYMFRDAVTRAVAYGTIPEAEKRALHGRIAETIERLAPGDPRRVAAVVAMHRERAADYQGAAVWYDRAIRLAVRGGLDREARDLAERWEGVVAKLPAEDRPDEISRARMAINKLVATARLGFPAEALGLGRTILRSSHWQALSDGKRGVVEYWLGMSLILIGEPDRARQRLKRVAETATQDWLRADAARELARLEQQAGNRSRAEAWIGRAIELAGEDTYRHAQIELVRGNVLSDAGELDAARVIYREVEQAAREHNHRKLVAAAITNIAYCHLRAGDFRAAQRGFENASELDHALGDWLAEAIDLVNVGQTMVWEGRHDDAIPVLERALTLGQELGDELTCAEARVHLGLALAMTRDPVEGARMCEAGRDQAARAQLRDAVVAADLHLLRVAVVKKDMGRARSLVQRCHDHGPAIDNPLFRGVLDALGAQVDTVDTVAVPAHRT